jgi:hypothetical protein
MERRDFLKLTPALPAAAPALSLTLKQPDGSELKTDVAVLRLQPGDTLVLMPTEHLLARDAQGLRDMLKLWAPQGVQVMILQAGMQLGVLRQG